MASAGAHVHLPLAQARPKWSRSRRAVLALGTVGALLFALSYTQVWWKFMLYAPQYPSGLRLDISLTGMGGDVHEIDLLNHYIGMAHLESAAPVERRLAPYGVAAIAVISLALLVASGRRLNKLVALPAIAFPVVFLADSLVWLRRFGHDLNPRAPLKIAAFTPQMFGNGKIGQFETFASPSAGFWIALAGVACIVAAAVIRMRVCADCSHAASCSVGCPRFMVLPDSRG